jgi:hypothetical protein
MIKDDGSHVLHEDYLIHDDHANHDRYNDGRCCYGHAYCVLSPTNHAHAQGKGDDNDGYGPHEGHNPSMYDDGHHGYSDHDEKDYDGARKDYHGDDTNYPNAIDGHDGSLPKGCPATLAYGQDRSAYQQ